MSINTPEPQPGKNPLDSVSFRSILDSLTDAVIIFDTSLKIWFWNTGAAELFGKTAEEVIGRQCHDLGFLCHRDKHGKKQCSTSSCLMGKILSSMFSGRFSRVIYMYTAMGEKIPVTLSTEMIRDSNSLIIGFCAVISSLKEQYHQVILAGEIQRRIVTTAPVKSGWWTFDTLYEPMEDTSGDFIEVLRLDDGRLLFTIADATGHGLSAGLFTMVYKSLLHANLGRHFDLEQSLAKLNKEYIKTVNMEGYYMTAVVALFDPGTGKGQYVSAGHPPMILFSRTPEGYLPESLLEATAPMLGLDPQMEFPSAEFSLEKSQILFAATDGVYEMPTVSTEPFGMEGAALFFRDHGAKEALKDLHEYLQGLSQYTEPVDDISMLLLYADGDDGMEDF